MARVVEGLLAVGVGLGVGFVAGRFTAPRPIPASAEDPAHRVRTRLASAMLARALADAVHAADSDDPSRPAVDSPGWSSRVPPAWRESAVEQVVIDVLATCDVDGQVLGLDCSEPPCAVVVAGAGIAAGEIAACAPWVEAYGEVPLRRAFGSACEEGVTVAFVAPAWPEDLRAADPGWVRAVDEAWGARVDALKSGWCAPN